MQGEGRTPRSRDMNFLMLPQWGSITAKPPVSSQKEEEGEKKKKKKPKHPTLQRPSH